MLDADLLRTFVAIADAGGFTRAAERLNLTQSTVSFQIRRLEQQAGKKLLRRTTRKVTLTPEGEGLLGYARGILQLQDAARRHLAGQGSLSGFVRLGASEDFASGGLAMALAGFRHAHPAIRLDVSVGLSRNLIAALDDDELDIVLGKRSSGDTRGEELWREPVVWATGAKMPDPHPLRPLPLALFPEPCVYRREALTKLVECKRPFEVVYVCPSYAGLKAAVLAGLAIAPLPRSVMDDSLRCVGARANVPSLSAGEFVLFIGKDSQRRPAVEALAAAIRSVRL